MKITSARQVDPKNVESFMGSNRPNRLWDWQAVALTIALVQIASARLAISEWVPSLNITQTLSLYAVVLGVALGYSYFSRRSVTWVVIAYGAFLIPMQLLTAIERSDSYYEDLKNLFWRLFNSLDLFVQNKPVDDPLFFVLLTSICFWVVGAYAGYHLTRHRNVLDVALAPGLIMLIIQVYDPWVPLRSWGLAVYIFLVLALLGRIHYLDNKINWSKKRILIPRDTEWEFSRSVLFTAAIAVFIAWALPGVLRSVRPAAEAWHNFTEPVLERLSDAVSALDSPYSATTGGDFYGSDLMLGTTAPVSDTPVFYVEANDTDINILRYYWRGRIYNEYKNGQWTNSTSLRQSFDPGKDKILLANPLHRSEVTFKITVNFQKQELLYGPAEMTWVDHESSMIVNALPEGERDVTAWFIDSSLVTGDSYEVRAQIAYPAIQELRLAKTEYPDWVTENYLQVPEEIEPQLKELAQQITAPYNTPYDKTQAITSYLRKEIRYETRISDTPPEGEDQLLWVLFDYKKGFCMYYASAEVLMLRTIGIPARMAVGFSQGEYDAVGDRYRVARLNAHAWPEVYFPGIGWVEFEPTANQDSLDRPQEEIPENERGINSQNNPSTLEQETPNQQDVNPRLNEDQKPPALRQNNAWLRLLLWPCVLLLLFIFGLYIAKSHSLTERLPVYLVERYTKSGNPPPRWLSNWAKWSSLQYIERAFHTINLSLHWLGQSPPSHTTPAERAHLLAKILPSAEKAIKDLAHELETALFTSHSANLPLARRASMKIIFETWRIRTFQYREFLKRRYN
jgi:transglutaminase-like putative cysteine protease